MRISEKFEIRLFEEEGMDMLMQQELKSFERVQEVNNFLINVNIIKNLLCGYLQ